MARYPEPGRVKTRLARVLGAEVAAALYRAFVLDLADRLAALPYPVTWAVDPPGAPFATLVPRASCRVQGDGDLGARMARSFAAEFAARPGPVAIIGADAPHLPAEALTETALVLGRGADVVLGPADDGGYYLIGLARPAPALFTDIPWSTSAVLAATIACAEAGELRTRLLPGSFDVDEPGDLARLAALLARGDVNLPRTAAFLPGLRSVGS
jgi:rSAM/selenodomain-associated transferase 1